MKSLLRRIPNRTVVNCDRQPYLTRWFLFRREAFAVFLHLFHRGDEDRALHDHPWSFITFILWRGYLEHCEEVLQCPECDGAGTVEWDTITYGCGTCSGTGKYRRRVVKRRRPLTIHYRPAEWRHRVELIDGKKAVTLVLRFRARREWGFWERTGFIKWNHWWQQNCE